MSIIQADCLQALAEMPEASVDAVVTDPPYNLAFMQNAWDTVGNNRQYQQWCETWASALIRVLKPGAYLAAFGACRTYHRLGSGLEDAGFEPKPMLAWLFASGFPTSLNDGQGRGTAMKPAMEPIALMQKAREGSYAANDALHGVGFLNIDDARVPLLEGEQPYAATTDNPQARAIGNMSGATKAHTSQGHADGRWPANVAHDGSDAVLAEFPYTKSGAGPCVMRKPYGGYSLNTNTVGRVARLIGDEGNAARFFFCAKPSTREKSVGLAGRTIHPTVKPIALMQWLIRLLAPQGGVVLDPFAGSGTTLIAAHLEGRECIGIEREAEYADIAEARLAWWTRNARPGRSVAQILGDAPTLRVAEKQRDLFPEGA